MQNLGYMWNKIKLWQNYLKFKNCVKIYLKFRNYFSLPRRMSETVLIQRVEIISAIFANAFNQCRWNNSELISELFRPTNHLYFTFRRGYFNVLFYNKYSVICGHRGLQRKLWAGYRALSLQRTSCCDYFSPSSVVSCAFSALCVYSKFGHHPHPLGYLCVKFRFSHGLHCSASPWTKIAYSLTHSPSLFDAMGTKAFTSE